MVHALAEHAVEIGQPSGVFVESKAECLQDRRHIFIGARSNQRGEFAADLRQVAAQYLMQMVHKQAAAVVGIAQHIQKLELQHAPHGTRHFLPPRGQHAQAVAGFFVAAFVAVEPVFQIVLLALAAFQMGERVEVGCFQIALDVDAQYFAAIRLVQQRERPAIHILILRINLRIEGMLALLGLRDKVMAAGGIGREQRMRLGLAFGVVTIAENKSPLHIQTPKSEKRFDCKPFWRQMKCCFQTAFSAASCHSDCCWPLGSRCPTPMPIRR